MNHVPDPAQDPGEDRRPRPPRRAHHPRAPSEVGKPWTTRLGEGVRLLDGLEGAGSKRSTLERRRAARCDAGLGSGVSDATGA